jgi:selenocysteine lyase/cysteine desulfurase
MADDADLPHSDLFDEEIYRRSISFLVNPERSDEITQYLRQAGFTTRTTHNYLVDLRSRLEVKATSTSNDDNVTLIIVDRDSGLEILPDHLVECRIASALANLEYDYSFDIRKASNTEIADKVTYSRIVPL